MSITWVLSNPTTPLNWSDIASDSTGQYLISCTDTNVYLSNDYGANFTVVTGGLPTITSPNQYTNVACSPDFKNLWVSIYSSDQSIPSYLSTNNGTSWTSVNLSSVGGNFTRNINPVAIDASYTIYLASANTSRLYKSTDDGINWNDFTTSTALYDPHSISISDNSSVICVTLRGGVNSLTIFTNYGNTYNSYFPSELGAGVACSSDGSTIYVATSSYTSVPYNQNIYKTTNGGANWTSVYNLSSTSSASFCKQISLSPNNNYVAAALEYTGIYISSDSGASFTLSAPRPNPENYYWTCTSVSNLGYLTSAASGGNMYYYYTAPAPVICFKEGSTILCLVDGKETYVRIETIRNGTLVKTSESGYLPVTNIGSSKIYNPANSLRYNDRLFHLSKEAYPELTDDLIITGGHSILVDKLTDKQIDDTKEKLGRIMISENKYRLMAVLDEKAQPYKDEGIFNIWHLSLENKEYTHNYGVYANGGLLVETASERMMKEYSGLELIKA